MCHISWLQLTIAAAHDPAFPAAVRIAIVVADLQSDAVEKGVQPTFEGCPARRDLWPSIGWAA